MKNTLSLAVAATLLLASCAKEIPPVTLQFTATIAPKDATKSVDADGNTAWVVGEKIAVYYQQTSGSHATAQASVSSVDATGAATLSATLTDAQDATEARFIYPYTLADKAGNINTTLLHNQHGTIADISAHFDAATGSATLVTNGTTCSTTGNISMVNRLFIGKFTPKSGGEPIDGITRLTITAGTDTYTATPAAGTFGTEGIYVAMLPVDHKTVSLTARTALANYSFAGVEASFEAGKLYTSLAIPMSDAQVIDLSTVSAATCANNGDVLTGTLGGHYSISIAAGATVTLDGVTINGDNNSSYDWAGISCQGNATIILQSGTTNTVRGFYEYYPGIHVPSGSTLTIQGSGSLNVSSNGSAAGIGGGTDVHCGHIIIEGGTITAQGGLYCAGIGGGTTFYSGVSATCGNITITGGTVTAIGGTNAAGIGTGAPGFAATSTCGDITIAGTVTRVTATKGGEFALCSIGKGVEAATCGTITIGGTVYDSGIVDSPYIYQP